MHISHFTEKIKVKTKTPLAKELDKLTAVLSTSFELQYARYSPDSKTSITIRGEDAGTIWEPNVALILEKSAVSSFGKGDTTVLDPEYRNGREIVAADIELGEWKSNEEWITHRIGKALFPGEARKVSVSLYKLAVYEKGGHFDWHRDTTHGDEHHATLLLALNTAWTGGDLRLRREGVTVSPKMHPKEEKGYNGGKSICTSLGVVTFYTDIEHMVEPVTEGVRIILQFDVHVSKAEKEKKKAADEDEEESEAQEGTVSRAVGVHCWKPDVPTSIPLSSAANDAIMDEIIAAIKNLHTDGVYEVGFPLQHLYRKASVLPAYLKCTDIRLYEALKQAFCVSLHPVLLEESSNYDGSWTIDRSGSDSGGEDYAGILAHKFDTPESESESDDNDPDSSDKRPKKKVKLQKVFYLPKMCPLVEIHSSEYVEYTGNEAQPAENKYFGAGFFVTAKKEENKNQ